MIQKVTVSAEQSFGFTTPDPDSDVSIGHPDPLNALRPIFSAAPYVDSAGHQAAIQSVAENSSGPFYTLNFHSPSLDAWSFTLTGADAGKFAVTAAPTDPEDLSSTGSATLTFIGPPDFEHGGSATGDNNYRVMVVVTGSGQETATFDLGVVVTDVNEAPVITSAAAASTPGGAAGTVYLATAADPDAGDHAHWAITGGADANLLKVDAASGAVSFVTAPDTLAPADANHDNVYVVELTDTDTGGLSASKTVAITVQNQALVVTSGASATTPENAAGTVYTATATDPNAGDHVTWAITGGADAGLLKVDPASGAVSFVAAPNFEAPADANHDNAYAIDLTGTDGHGLTATTSVTVNVTNLNEAPTVTSAATASTPENAAGTIYTATATDADTGDHVTWSISGGADASLLKIDAASGAVSFVASPDFEAPADANHDNTYAVDLTASDSHGLATTQSVAISVTNVNEAPVFHDVPAAGPQVSAEFPTTPYWSLPAPTDPEGDPVTVAVTGQWASNFDLLPRGDGTYVLHNTNFTSASTNALVDITATDSHGLSSVVQIQTRPWVPAIDDSQAIGAPGHGVVFGSAPYVDSIGNQAALQTVAENSTGPFYTVNFTGGVSGAWSFTLTGADAGKFAITALPSDPHSFFGGGGSATLSFIGPPDFEHPGSASGDNSYSVAVVVSDSAGDTATLDLGVAVTDVNEAPVITSAATASTPENTAGTVYTATATDPDFGDHVTWSITGGADAPLLHVDAASGALSFVAARDFEAPADAGHDNSYVVDLTATDSHGLAATRTVTVAVTNVAEGGTMTGTDGADTLVTGGDQTGETVSGNGGNDSIASASTGADSLSGGSGADTIVHSGDGAVAIDGGSGDDVIVQTGSGPATISGSTGSDTATIDHSADSAAETVSVGGSTTTVSDGTMVSTVKAVETTHVLTGSGDDAATYANPIGTHTLDAGGGSNSAVVSLTGATTSVTHAETGTGASLTSVDGGGSVTLSNVQTLKVTAGSGNDSLSSGSGHDAVTLSGAGGQDSIGSASTGHDNLSGGSGNDTVIHSGAGSATLSGGDGDDVIVQTGSGSAAITGGTGNDTATVDHSGDSAPTTVTVSGANTSVSDGTAFSTVKTVETTHVVTGAGDDTATYTAPSGTHTLDAGAGANAATLNLAGATTSVTHVESGTGASQTTIDGGGSVTLSNVQTLKVTAGSGNDSLSSGAGHAGVTLSGAAGQDSIASASTGADSLSGGAGNDTIIHSGAGSAILSGGDGNDVIVQTGSGQATISGDAGNDTATLDHSSDGAATTVKVSGAGTTVSNGTTVSTIKAVETTHVMTGAGDDTATYARTAVGANSFDGGGGTNSAVIDRSAATTAVTTATTGGTSLTTDGATTISLTNVQLLKVTGGSAGDTLAGGTGASTLSGNDGADSLAGGVGADRLTGGAGNDTLDGGGGNDTLTGGAGADLFMFGTGNGTDRITDFQASDGDRVQLATGTTYGLNTVGGSAVIDLGAGDKLILSNIASSSLTDWLTFY